MLTNTIISVIIISTKGKQKAAGKAWKTTPAAPIKKNERMLYIIAKVKRNEKNEIHDLQRNY